MPKAVSLLSESESEGEGEVVGDMICKRRLGARQRKRANKQSSD